MIIRYRFNIKIKSCGILVAFKNIFSLLIPIMKTCYLQPKKGVNYSMIRISYVLNDFYILVYEVEYNRIFLIKYHLYKR